MRTSEVGESQSPLW